MNKLLIAAITLLIIIGLLHKFMPYDDTDDITNKKRSGLKLYTDYGTGCQYLATYQLIGPSSIIKRTDYQGNHIGCIK